jgi:hypothetical protein
MCLLAEGMESEGDISDDDSDTPSYDELLDLIHEQQIVMKRQAKEIKQLNALMTLMLLLLQIMMIYCANSNFLARSMKSSN